MREPNNPEAVCPGQKESLSSRQLNVDLPEGAA